MTLELQSERIPNSPCDPEIEPLPLCDARAGLFSVRISKTPAIDRAEAAGMLRRVSGHDRKKPPPTFVEENPPVPANEIVDYQSLVATLRARADSLEISRGTIDSVAGLADGHASKILALSRLRRIGMESLGPMLDALCLKLVAMPCDEAFERNRSRLVKRDDPHYRSARQGHDGKPRTRKPPKPANRKSAFAKISGIATATLGGAVHYVAPPRFGKLSGAVTATLG
jgi:hypothetical protein